MLTVVYWCSSNSNISQSVLCHLGAYYLICQWHQAKLVCACVCLCVWQQSIRHWHESIVIRCWTSVSLHQWAIWRHVCSSAGTMSGMAAGCNSISVALISFSMFCETSIDCTVCDYYVTSYFVVWMSCVLHILLHGKMMSLKYLIHLIHVAARRFWRSWKHSFQLTCCWRCFIPVSHH